MRTGAIFARGSCRALTWAAIMGAFALLGSTQAAAQPTISSAVYDGSNTVMVTMSESVYASGTLAASLFAIDANTGTSHTVPTSASAASTTFTVTFTSAVTAPGGGLAYTLPVDGTSGGVVNASGVQLAAVTFTMTPRPISLGLAADIRVPMGAAMTPVSLPAATGGVGTVTYSIPAFGTGNTGTHTAGELPPGLSFVASTRTLSGIATGAVGTRYPVNYTATDSDTGTANTDTVQFFVTVVAAPTAPGAPTISMSRSSVTNTTITVMWDPPTSGTVTNYEFRYGVPGSSVAARTTMFTPNTWFEISGLTPGMSYTVDVRALNAVGTGPWSAAQTFTAGPGATTQVYVPISTVTVGSLVERGQTQATVYLSRPVPPRATTTVEIRLVGKMQTREGTSRTSGGPVVANLATYPPMRMDANGVRTELTGELGVLDYDAEVVNTLTIQAGESSGSVTVYASTDDDAEDEILLLQVIPSRAAFVPSDDRIPAGSGGRERLFMVRDSHEQGYALTAVPAKIYESGNFATVSTLHFTPNHRQLDDPPFVTLRSNHEAYEAVFPNGRSTTQLPTTSDSVMAEFQLLSERRPAFACSCDGDRIDNEVVVSAIVNGQVVAETTVEVVDVHKLPEITVTAMTKSGTGPLTEVEEGSTYNVRVEANRNKPSGEVTNETVTVSLKVGDGSTAVADADFVISPSSVDISGSPNVQTKTFTLQVLAGDGDIGDEMLVLNAMVKGKTRMFGTEEETKGMLSLDVVDVTTLNVEPRPDAEVKLAVVTARNAAEGADDLWTSGDDDLAIKLGDLFRLPAEGFTVSADATSADAKVVMAEADEGVVSVTAVGPGTTTVTVTATTATSASGASGAQISPDIASVEFEVEVDELALVLMLSGPEDMDMMNLVEGGDGAMVTVTANQKVAEDIEVMIMRDRSKSTASEDDYEVGMLTIEAGEMSGTTMVMAVEDDMAEDMEELVLYAMAGDIQATGEVKFYLWDAAVPALPIIAQFLLAALMAVGGYRRYRRR